MLVTGATGNVGLPLVAALTRESRTVRTAARHLAVNSDPCVDAVQFDFTDPSTFDAAFAGVEVMFLVRPPALANPSRDLIPALERAVMLGLKHVVFLSVQGVERLPFIPHARIETWLRSSGLGWTFLRASFFDQNLVTVHGPAIRAYDELIMPAGRGRTAFVDTHDVADLAAQVMLEPGQHRGRAYTVTGSEALTYGEVAGIMTAVLGRPIRYRQPGLLSYLLRAHRQLRLTPQLIAATSMVYTTARVGLAAGLSDDAATVLGRSPTTMAEFIARERASFTPEAHFT